MILLSIATSILSSLFFPFNVFRTVGVIISSLFLSFNCWILLTESTAPLNWFLLCIKVTLLAISDRTIVQSSAESPSHDITTFFPWNFFGSTILY